MKWPEKRYNDPSPEGKAMDESWNMAIDACRAALEEACDREMLAKIIHEAFWLTKFEEAIEIDKITAYEAADAIRRYLGFEDN